MGGPGASGSRRAGGSSGMGAGYGGGSGFMRPGPLATGSRTSSDHGGLSGASTSRSAGMGMGYNVSLGKDLETSRFRDVLSDA